MVLRRLNAGRPVSARDSPRWGKAPWLGPCTGSLLPSDENAPPDNHARDARAASAHREGSQLLADGHADAGGAGRTGGKSGARAATGETRRAWLRTRGVRVVVDLRAALRRKSRPQPSLRDRQPEGLSEAFKWKKIKEDYFPDLSLADVSRPNFILSFILFNLPAASRPRLSRSARLWLVGPVGFLRRWLRRSVWFRQCVRGRRGSGLRCGLCGWRFYRRPCGRDRRPGCGCG